MAYSTALNIYERFIMKKGIILISLALTVSGCATSRIEEKLDQWIGKSERNVIVAYGAPTSIYEISKTEKVISYEASAPGVVMAPTSSYNFQAQAWTHGTSGVGVQRTCKINFVIKDKTVKEYSYDNAGACVGLNGLAKAPTH